MGALDENVGALFVGCLVTTTLFGVTCSQTVTYLRHHGPDGVIVLGVVVLLMLLDALHTILISHLLYTFVITNFGNIVELEIIPWTLSSSLVVHVASDTAVRIFFVRRVWVLSKHNILITGLLTVLIISTVGFNLFISIRCFELKSLKWLFLIHWEICTGLALVMATDLGIAASLCWYLCSSRKREYLGETNSVINTLCLYTVNTGLLTTLCSLGCLISYVASPKTLIFVAFYLPLSKFYVNAFLASLNARQGLRERYRLARASSAKGLRLNAYGAASQLTVTSGVSRGAGHSGQNLEASSTIFTSKVGSETDRESFVTACPSVKIGEAL